MGITQGPGGVKRKLKPKGHLIASRKTEIVVGVILFALGVLFLWDASSGRNKEFPWPVGGIMPW